MSIGFSGNIILRKVGGLVPISRPSFFRALTLIGTAPIDMPIKGTTISEARNSRDRPRRSSNERQGNINPRFTYHAADSTL